MTRARKTERTVGVRLIDGACLVVEVEVAAQMQSASGGGAAQVQKQNQRNDVGDAPAQSGVEANTITSKNDKIWSET